MPSILLSLLSVLAIPALLVQGRPYDIAQHRHNKRDTDVIRGVNIGGWLLLEPYMNYAIMGDSEDQWSFDQTDGAESALADHWSSWFTEDDMEQIAAWGLNTVRIPIGFWAYNNTGTPYISGADDYLETALGWARTYGIKALICAHGMPGSQNGWENSGHDSSANWITSNGEELELSLDVLQTIVTKYGTSDYADVVWGVELVNEPVVWDDDSFDEVTAWATSAFNALMDISENDDLKIIMHDAFVGASMWENVGVAINDNCTEPTFYLDLHLYQNQDASYDDMTQAEHIAATCAFNTTQFLPSSTSLPIIVGEFSDQTNICVDANGTVTAGTSCNTTDCQCSADLDTSEWNGYLVNATRLFLETQLDVFEEYSEGWFIWSYSGPGAWGLTNLFEYGVIGPDDVTQREFPAQCS